MAIWYAYGPAEFDEGIPASAFSKGDLLCYTSASSLSRHNSEAHTADILGVAAAASTQSVANKVSVIKANSDTVFWADCNGSFASRKGDVVGIAYSAATGHFVSSTGTVARAVVERAAADIPQQSVKSRVLVRLIGHDGNLAHS